MQVIFLGLVAAMFILGVLSLLCYHIYLLLNNKTTIESFRVPIFIHGTEEDAKRGFGIGWRNNFVQVFGTKRRFWILPVPTWSAILQVLLNILQVSIRGSNFFYNSETNNERKYCRKNYQKYLGGTKKL